MSSGSDRIPPCIDIIVSERNRTAAFYPKKGLISTNFPFFSADLENSHLKLVL
jgi:hypothetical protein